MFFVLLLTQKDESCRFQWQFQYSYYPNAKVSEAKNVRSKVEFTSKHWESHSFQGIYEYEIWVPVSVFRKKIPCSFHFILQSIQILSELKCSLMFGVGILQLFLLFFFIRCLMSCTRHCSSNLVLEAQLPWIGKKKTNEKEGPVIARFHETR